jgi:aminoglycoside phosphotransferase (APT) family kinase protein
LLGDFTRLRVADAEARAWMAAAETGAEVLGGITEARVLHGDPWPKNVLVRREEGRMRIVALLDHERGLFGDPWQEWVFHGCDFPPVFWEAFGARPTDPASLFRAAIYRGVIDLQCLLEAVRYDWDAAEVRPRLLAGAAEMRRLRAELRP